MARPRLPREAKILKGTFHKYRNPEKEASPAKVFELPPPPPPLTAHGAEMWNRAGPELIRDRLFTEADYYAFEQMCLHHGNAMNLYDELTLGKSGKKKTRAALTVTKENIAAYNAMKKEFDACTALMIQFGMTPAARNRFSVPNDSGPTEEEKTMEALLNA
jgi:P27 family predicted phage terminase small subunit